MRLTRFMAYRERSECSQGHRLDVWVRPRAPGVVVDPMRRCATCGTLFVLTSTAPRPALPRPALEHDDDTCPGCRTPFAQTHAYPAVPSCPECAARVAAWLTDGPDLPASAVTVLRCWAVSPAVVDLREPSRMPRDAHARTPQNA